MNPVLQKLVALAVTLLTSLCVSAYDFETDGIYYNITNPTAKEVEVTYGENQYSYSGDIDVPTSVTYNNEQYTVTAIGQQAFYGSTELTSITLPNSITAIGELAFYGCSTLISINVDADNQTYSSIDGILYDKPQTSLICCPVGKTGDVIVPNAITAIGDEAFAGCYGLTSITLPNTLITIGDVAFSGCNGLTSITLPNSVTTIGDGAFSGCRNLTSIAIPNSVTTIGDEAFYVCSKMTSIDVDVDNQAYSSVDGILYDKPQTSLICCPGGKTGDIIVPNTVTAIGNEAFAGCYGLTSITLPNALTTIGDGAFNVCSKMTSIDVDVDNQTYSSVDGILYNKAQTSLVCCPRGKTGDIIVPNTVTAIGNEAFAGCYGLTSITLPNALTTIGDEAFSGCRNLTSIAIPNSVTAIGNEAFYYCRSLTSITLPNTVTTIGNKAFYQCENLTSITLPNTLTAIGNEAFYYCRNLTSITLPNSLTTIGSRTFASCYGLTSIVLPNILTTIGESAFNGCSSLTSIAIPGTVTSIGDGAFTNCIVLTSIDVDVNNPMYSSVEGILYDKAQTSLICCPGGKTGDIIVPNTVTAIWSRAFIGCNGLKSVVLSNSLTTIGDDAFSNCYSLTSIAIPGTLTSIGDFAFAACSSLTSITSLAVTPPECAESTFASVDKHNCAIFVPAESVNAYKEAIGWKDFGFIDEVGGIRSFEVNGIYYNVTDPTAKEVEVTKGENIYSGDIIVPSTVKYNGIQYTVTTIGDETFNGCSDITSITLPNSLITIRDNAFNHCSSLTSITLPNSVTTIGDFAFHYCSGLTSITLPNSLTTIGDRVFYYCSSLTSIVLPNTLTTIGDYAFAVCSAMTSITSLAVIPPVCTGNTFNRTFIGVNKKKCTLYVPAESVDAYKQAPVWNEFGTIEEADPALGIEDINASEIDRPNDIYNMQGVCLKRNASQDDINALAPGFYIVGGKKVVVK